MTDARLPSQWLGKTWLDSLSDAARVVFDNALMWSNDNGTDGHVPETALRLLHPSGTRMDCAAELVTARLWGRVADGWQMPRWDARPSIGDCPDKPTGGMGQMTAQQVRDDAERHRVNSENYRRSRGIQPRQSHSATDDVTDDATDDATVNVGQGQGTKDAGTMETSETSNPTYNDDGWLAGRPASHQPPPTGVCAVCGEPLDPVLIAEGDTTHPNCDP